MELRQLTCFATLARELHFGHAAAALFMSQPALSKQIVSLERELGVQLFDRTRRSVVLNESGRQLLPEAERIVELAQRFEHNADAVRSGRVGRLRLGYTGAVAAGAMSEVLRHFRAEHPDVVHSLREATTQAVLDDVRDGVFDAAFVRYTGDVNDVRVTLLKTEPAVLAMSVDHAYAAREYVRFAELADQAIVMMTRPVEPQLYDHALALCAAAGFSPHVVHEADSVQTTLAMVAAGIGVAVVTSSAQALGRDDIVFRTLVDPTPAVSLRLVHRTDNRSPSLAAFVEAATELARRWDREQAVDPARLGADL